MFMIPRRAASDGHPTITNEKQQTDFLILIPSFFNTDKQTASQDMHPTVVSYLCFSTED